MHFEQYKPIKPTHQQKIRKNKTDPSTSIKFSTTTTHTVPATPSSVRFLCSTLPMFDGVTN
jgi:hypothetical protein